MTSLGQLLFVLFAPITIPIYLLFLAYVNLAGLAFFVVGEMTLDRISGRVVRLPSVAFWLLSPFIILIAAPVLLIHLAIWAVRVVLAGSTAAGRWQTDLRSKPACLVLGTAWTALFAWTVVFSIDGILAMNLIRRPFTGAADYSAAVRRHFKLSDLPAAMQARRRELVQSFRNGPNSTIPRAAFYADLLSDDGIEYGIIPEPLKVMMAGMPWYYVPAELSYDGGAHCRVLPGLLLLALLLMIRWRGRRRSRRNVARSLLSFTLRFGLTASFLAYSLTWAPPRLSSSDSPRTVAPLDRLAPLTWCHVDRSGLLNAPPQWLLLNLAIGLLFVGAATALWLLAARIWPILSTPNFYSAFLAGRLLQRKRIAFFSIGAVTLCVAMLLIVISVMGGFVDTIRNRATGLLGDLVMDGDLRGFPYYDQFIADLRSWPEIKQATPLISSFGTLRFEKGDTFPVRIWGVRLNEYVQVNSFGRDLWYNQRYPGTTILTPIAQPFYGYDVASEKAVLPEPYQSALTKWLNMQPPAIREEFAPRAGGYFPGPGIHAVNETENKPAVAGREYPGIIIGRDLLFRRQPSGEYSRLERYPRGCKCVVTMIPLTRTGGLMAESPPSPAFRYIDDSRTGIFEIDSKNVYVSFDVLQDKLAMIAAPRANGQGEAPPRCSQIQIKLKPGADLREMKLRVDDAWMNFIRDLPGDADDMAMARSVRVSTWEELQADYIAAIQKEKVLVVVMFSVISLVAVFLVLCIFYMIVIEKTRDIGIIKSVGGSAEGVAAVFLTYGAAIGIVGSTLGSVIGFLFVRRINDIQDWLARLNPAWRVWSPETYSFDKIPDMVQTSDIVFISVAAVIASILGAVVPALRAAKTWPVEALRYE